MFSAALDCFSPANPLPPSRCPPSLARPTVIESSAANHDDAAFREFRESRALSYDMSLEDYDSAHEQYRTELLAVAESLDVHVNQGSESYADVLAKVEEAAARRARRAHAAKAVLLELEEEETSDAEDSDEPPRSAAASAAASLHHNVDLESLRSGAALFAMRATLLEAVSDDVVTRNMATDLDASVQGVINYVRQNKCGMCRKLRIRLPEQINSTLISQLKLNRSVAEHVGMDVCEEMLQDNDPSFKIFGHGLCQYPVRFAYQIAQWYALGTRNITIRAAPHHNETMSAKHCICQSFAPKMVFPRMRIFDLQINPQTILENEAPCAVDKWSTQCLSA